MVYVFGDCELDERRYVLRRAGERVELEPKVFEVLAYLIRHNDRVVPRRELLDELWPDRIVGEWSLTRSISVARKALRDNAGEQRVIQTLYGRGYRFVARVRERPARAPDIALREPGAEVVPERRSAERPPLVGRSQDLAELLTGLDAALEGHGRPWLVSGETGVGKTRLVEELAERAPASGFSTRFGRCWEAEGTPAFWPWVQIVRGEAQAREPARLQALLGAGAADIAQVVPDLRELLPELPAQTGVEPRQARFRLFDAVTRFLKRSAEEQPLLLILEDLHRADPASLRLLQFLARDLAGARILLVGTYRNAELERDPERARIASELARESSAQHLHLAGLPPESVAEFVLRTTGEPADETLVQALYEQTGGNPFFLSQLVPALAEPGNWDGDPARLPLPHGARNAILRQLDGLSEACREVLEVAAVVGRDFPAELLESAMELAADRLLERLGEATRAGVVLEEGDRGRFRFAHALVRDTLYAGLAPLDRARWHHRIALGLEQSTGSVPGDRVAELAHHFALATPVGAEKKALDYAVSAGHWAVEQIAYEEASRHYRRALELVERLEPADDARRCELLVALGEAELRGGNQDAARVTLVRAAEIARALRDPEPLAEVAVATARGFVPFATGVVPEQLVSLLEEALGRLGERDSPLRARALACLTSALYWSDAHERREQLGEESIEVARRAGDPATLVEVLSTAIIARWGPDLLEERLELANEAVRLGERAGIKQDLIDARVVRIAIRFELGEMAAVDRDLAEIGRLAAELRHPETHLYLPYFRATRAIMQGQFELGERLADEFVAQVEKRQDPVGVQAFGIQYVLLRSLQGRFDEVVDLVGSMVERNPASAFFRAALARAYCELGRVDEALGLLELLAPPGAVHVARNIEWLPSVALLAELAAVLGNRQRCTHLYDVLAPYARRHVTSGGLAYLGPASRYLGILATALRRTDIAARHFEVALEMQAEVGALPSMAATQCDYAALLFGRERPGDRERAEQLQSAAGATARKLGMGRLAAQAERLG